MREINCSSIVYTDTSLDLALGAFSEILAEWHASMYVPLLNGIFFISLPL
jgi:hypothetical protein